MRKTKRFLTLLLAIAMIINPIFYNSIPLDEILDLSEQAKAEDSDIIDSISYTDSNNITITCEIKKNGHSTLTRTYYTLNIFSNYCDLYTQDYTTPPSNPIVFERSKVNDFLEKYRLDIKEINIDWITEIEKESFKNFFSLEEVNIGNKGQLKIWKSKFVIGSYAFAQCENLKYFNWWGDTEGGEPSSPQMISCFSRYIQIGDDAFQNCGFEYIRIYTPYVGTGAFYNCKSLKKVDLRAVTNIKVGGGNIFESFAGADYYIGGEKFNNNEENIGSSAFKNCTSLTDVTLPNMSANAAEHYVKDYVIGANAFSNCTSLTTINNMDTYKGIYRNEAFSNCTSLENITIDINYNVDDMNKHNPYNQDIYNTLTKNRSEGLFKGCTSLKNVKIITSTGGTKSLKIYNDMFKGCSSLQNVDMTGTCLNTIGESAFSGCTSLTDINANETYSSGLTLTSNTVRISEKTFADCTSLKSLTFPTSNITTESNAFSGCTSLTNIDMSKVISLFIENKAFSNCTALTDIYIPKQVTNISGFSGCTSLKNIQFEDKTKVNSIGGFEGCKFENLDYSEFSNLKVISTDAFKNCESLTNIILPKSLTTIGNSAFENCTGLSHIEIPAGITTIGNSAFKNCMNISYIELPENITTIGDSAFKGCNKFKSMNIPGKVSQIGNEAFSNCTGLTEMNLSGLESLTKISKGLFSGCTSLKKVILPYGIINVQDEAFKDCPLEYLVLYDSVSDVTDNSLKDMSCCLIITNDILKQYCETNNLDYIFISQEMENLFSNRTNVNIDLTNISEYKGYIEIYNNLTEEQRNKLETYYSNASAKIILIESAFDFLEKNKDILESDAELINMDNLEQYNKLYSDYMALNNSIRMGYSEKIVSTINSFVDTAKKYNFIKDYTNLLSSETITLSYNPLEIDNSLSTEEYNNFNSKYSELTEIDKEFVENYFTKLNIGSIINYINKGESFLTKYQDILNTDETIVIDETNKDRFTELVQEYMNITSNSKIVFSDKITEKIKDLQDYFKKDALVKEIDSFVESNGSTETSVSADNMEEIVTLSAMYENLTEEEKTEIANQYPDLQIDNISKIGDFLSNTTGSQMYCDLINKTSDEMTVENSDDFKNMLNDFSGLTDEVKNMFSEAIKTNVEQLIQKYNELNVFTVTFMDGILILKTETVSRGNGATAPVVNDKSGYKFVGWDKEFNNITGNLTVNALWKEEPTTTEPVETTTEQKPEETTTEQTTTKPDETTTEQKPEETTKEQTTTKLDETTTEQKPEETTTEQTTTKLDETTTEQETTKPGETPTEQSTTSSVEPENSIKNAVISLQYKSTTYDGTQKKPTVTVKNKNGAALKNGTDYSITYKNNINVGTASVVITGKGNYTSSVTMNFKISQASISKATAILKYISVSYSGSAKKPSVTVKLSNKTLKKNTDYKVTYSNNVNAGTASVKISGINNYKGTKTKQFTITKLNITKASVKLKYTSTVYDGKTKKPSATVKYGKKTLKLNKDYKISYKKNKTVGVASVYITGKGNYRGTKIATFKIKAQSMKKAKVKLQYSKTTYTKSAKKPKVSVTYGKNKLKANKDYVVTYSGNINVGKAKVIISGRGNYSGSITKTFSITPKSIASSDVKAILSYTSTEYNGVAKTPFVTVYDKNTSVGNSNFRCAYENNNQIGTASVKITGMGNYTGTITKNFIINPVKTDISSVNVNGTEITLKWNSVGGASGYELSFKRAADNTWQTMETTNTTQSMFATVIAGSTQYDFRVRSFSSVNGAKYYSDYSLVKSVMVTG